MRKPVPEDFSMTSQEYVSLVAQLCQDSDTKSTFVPEDCGWTNQQYLSILTQRWQGAGFAFNVIGIWVEAFSLSIIGALLGAGFGAGVGAVVSRIILGDITWNILLYAFETGGALIGAAYVFNIVFTEAYRKKRKIIQRLKQLSDPRYQKVALYEEAIREYHYRQESYWKSLRGAQFERALARLYKNLGYSVQETKGSHDEGIDLKLQKDGKRIIVQCKGHEKPIGVGAIRDLCGAMMHARAERAVLVCPAGFTDGVRKFADGKPIELLTAKELVEMAESVR